MTTRLSDFKIFIAIPSYDGKIDFRLCNALMQASKGVEHSFNYRNSSLLAWTFNGLWCDALNQRSKKGYTHFLMVHADIIPEPWFADKMLAIIEEEKAAILSAVIPIKNANGLTSTAIDTDEWKPSRLTTTQVQQHPTPTFSHPRLLVNTGLMMVDLRKPWVNDAFFTVRDGIERDHNGVYSQRCQPEDWAFSRAARKANAGRICATKAVGALHVGSFDFSNQHSWGWETDEAYGEAIL